MARIFEAGFDQHLLLDRVGDHAAGSPGLDQRYGLADRMDDGLGIAQVGPPGHHRRRQCDRQHRHGVGPDGLDRFRPVDLADPGVNAQHFSQVGQSGWIVDQREARHTGGTAGPGGESDFATDTRRLAHGQDEGQHGLSQILVST